MTKQLMIELIGHRGNDRIVLVEENDKELFYTVSRQVHEELLEQLGIDESIISLISSIPKSSDEELIDKLNIQLNEKRIIKGDEFDLTVASLF